MELSTTLEDLIGIEYAKLGFFREVQEKIAELHASNLELVHKQRHIEAILKGITDVMVVLTRDLRISSVNHVFEAIYHDPKPQGKPCYQVIRRQFQCCSDCPAQRALETNELCRETVIYSVNGQNRHFEITASPLRNQDGQPCRILLLKRDVTLEKEYQAKFYQAERMATVGLLAAGVAHEINNPLTAILGFAQGLKRRLPKLEGRMESDDLVDFQEYIGTILREGQRCQEIVQSLLTFSRKPSPYFAPVNLNALVGETLSLVRNKLKHCPRDLLTLELDQTLPVIQGDVSQLKQVILNLVLNALDAIDGQGRVKLRTFSRGEKWVHLAVEDTGRGIALEHQDKLFEPFFTTKPVGQGIGIGLSTCYNIVQQHGGEITVCSEEGKGSTFMVRLPREGA
jgi:two-component system, NtrC family, sensor kinase